MERYYVYYNHIENRLSITITKDESQNVTHLMDGTSAETARIFCIGVLIGGNIIAASGKKPANSILEFQADNINFKGL